MRQPLTHLGLDSASAGSEPGPRNTALGSFQVTAPELLAADRAQDVSPGHDAGFFPRQTVIISPAVAAQATLCLSALPSLHLPFRETHSIQAPATTSL